MEYREVCPSWVAGNKENAHPLTNRGTVMHAAVETGDFHQLEGREHELVQACLDQIEWAERTLSEGETRKEVRLNTSIPNLWGTIDYLRIQGNTAIAMDWKFGFMKVEDPKTNAQAASYVLGIFDQYPEVKVIIFKFIMPRINILLSHAFNRHDYDRIHLRLQTVIARCEEFRTAFNPCRKACQFCGNIGRCSAVSQALLPLAEKYSDGLPELPRECHPSLITDPAEMARALLVAKVFAEYASSASKHALELSRRLNLPIEDPERGIYFEPVSRAGKKTITDPNAAWAEARDAGVTQEEFMEACSVSPAKLKKIVAANLPRGNKQKGSVLFLEKLRAQGALKDGKNAEFLTQIKNK